MAWFPGAIRKEVTRFNPGGDLARLRIKGRGICDHVAASEAASLFNYFNEPGNPCSHFYVRRSGIIEQYVDTDWVAPANLEGNPTLLSIETQGGATESTVDSEPWEPAALDALIQLHIWLQKIDGFPIQEMPNSLSISKGVGYHRLGIDPWRVSGGELWSRSTGKLCPGLEKIRQIR
ncbi:MAG TPA: N-acetylmuramoyl-L-alanine amidase, partial [Streptosporangiaceae bacterium]